MSDNEDNLFTIELTEDEIDQCTHAINELCEVFIKDGHSLKELEIQSYLNTARKLESLVSRIIKTYLVYNPNNNLYKIGVSENPSKSVSSLRYIEGSNLEILYIVNEDLESELRRRFSIQHHASDWFTDDGGSMQAYFKNKSMDIKEEPTDRFAMGAPSVAHAGENKEVKLSTGQTWTHKQKGYDVKIDYINRTGDVVVEEVATGQRDGFGRKAFLERFSPKSKDGDA